MNKSLLNIYILTSIYFILSFIGILNHEIWFDEAHHWLLSRESINFKDLLYNTRYEGHPKMWGLLLYFISRFSYNPFWMQLLHIIISSLTVFVFLKKAPFSILFKSLFIFGYFMLFEYNLLARNYMLGLLFLFLAMSLFKNRHENFLLFSLFLALSCNVHLMFVVLSSAIFFIVLTEHFENKTVFQKKNIFGYLLFIFGIIFSIIQMIPPYDSTFLEGINNLPIVERLGKGFIAVWKGLITIPDFRTIHFWNTNIFTNINKPLSVVFGILIYFLPLIIFHKNKKVLFYVYLSIFGAQLFFYITQRGTTRSHGMIYLIFLIGLWIEKYYDTNPLTILKKISPEVLLKLKSISIYSILCIHLFSGIWAYSIDFKNPFTPAKEIVNFIKNSNYQKKVIISRNCDSPISTYTEEKIFTLCTNSFEAFCHWNFECTNNEKAKTLLSFLKEQKTSCIYITIGEFFDNENMKENKVEIEKNIEMSMLKTYNQSIVPKRDYYIYEMKYKGE